MATPSLDPSVWVVFQDLIRARFGPASSVTSPDGHFFLIASFSRCSFHLDESSVAAILQSVLGGCAEDFRVQSQAFMNFKFSVANKHIGLMVHCLTPFVGYLPFISLSVRDGGPNFLKEKTKWDLEQEAQWTHISRDKKKSYAFVAKRNLPRLLSLFLISLFILRPFLLKIKSIIVFLRWRRTRKHF